MLRRAGMCLLVMALVLFAISCTKLPDPTTQSEGGLAIEKLEDVTAIPPKFGKLISVSAMPEDRLFQLWFQDEDGNIRMVTFEIKTNRLWSNVTLIPQK